MSGRVLPFRRASPPGPVPRAAVAPAEPVAAPSGPEQAQRFRSLVMPHLDAAYSLARYLARDAHAAEDIAQEALLKAYRKIETLRAQDAKPWLMAIVRNAYFDWRRQQAGDAISGAATEAALEETADLAHVSAEDALIARGDVAALRGAIAALPEPFREALVLRDLEELSYRQIAEVTGAPMGTVMSRLARARGMLAERLGLAEAAS